MLPSVVLGIWRKQRKLANKIFKWVWSCHTMWMQLWHVELSLFQPPQSCHACPLCAQGLRGEMIIPDLCCSRRNRSLMSWRLRSAARPGNLPVASRFHAWPLPKFCAAGRGNGKCHGQLCIFSSSSVMQIPPPQVCSACFVCRCRSTTNLQWSNISTGGMGCCVQS